MRRWLVALIGLSLLLCALVPAQSVRRRPIVASAADPLLTSLVASWKLDDLTDSAGANTLTNNNSVTFSTGKIGNAGYFTLASSMSLSIASNAAVQTGDVDFTIAGWVWVNGTTTQLILAKRGAGAGTSEYAIYLDDSTARFTALVFRATDSAVSRTAATFGAPSANTWYCFIFWHDATADTLNISINDGATDSVGTTGALQAASTGLFTIGKQDISGGELYLDGRVDDVNIWKRVLTAGERTRFYAAGVGCEHPFSACP